jgi:hypothetical protein
MLNVIEAPAPTTDHAVTWDLAALQTTYDVEYDKARGQSVELMPALLDALARDDQPQLDDVLDDVMLEAMADVMPAPLVAQAMILLLAGRLLAARAGR